MYKYLFFVISIGFVGCNFDHDVDAELTISLDECATCFPRCVVISGGDEFYGCVTQEGEECEDCRVGCFFGESLYCGEEYPECSANIAGTVVDLPPICVGTYLSGGG